MAVSVSTVGVVALVVTLLGYLVYRAALPRPIPGIPYNPVSATRILGDVPDLSKYQAEHGEFFGYISQLGVKLNAPIFQAFMFPFKKPWVIVLDPREAHDIMTRRTGEFDRSDFFGQIFRVLLPKGHAHFSTNDEWHAHRRLLNDTMSPAFLNKVAGPQMWKTARSLIELWKEKARLAQGRPVELAKDAYNTSLDIIWASTFGDEIGPNRGRSKLLADLQSLPLGPNVDEAVKFPEPIDPPAFTSIKTLIDSFIIPVQSPFPEISHWIALNTRRVLFNARREKDRLIESKLKEAKQMLSQSKTKSNTAPKDLKCALGVVVSREVKAAEAEGRPVDLDNRVLKDELFQFLVAGGETTATTLNWGIKFLAHNQDVQSKLRNALYTAFPNAKETPSIEDITSASLPYLDAVIEETIRVGVISPGTMRRAKRDSKVLGCVVPEGTDVLFPSAGPGYLMQTIDVREDLRSASSKTNKDRTGAWGTDMGEFRPERWIDHEGKFDAAAGPSNGFGYGPRSCFGKRLAVLEEKVLFIFVVWNLELLPAPPALSTFRSIDAITHSPEQCYARLRALK